MGFTELLTIVFVDLKLIGRIDWSWWWVLLPEIIGVIFYVLLMIANLRSSAAMNRSINRMCQKEQRRRYRG